MTDMKKLLVLIFFLISFSAFGQLTLVNVGTVANDGTGDKPRTAFIKVNSAITLLNNVQLYNLNSTELAILDGALVTTAELNYSVGVTSNIQDQFDDIEDAINDTVVGLTAADTILYFAPVIGAGNAGDTTLFSYGDVIWACKWDGSYDLVITKVTGVVYGTTPDIDVALLYDVNFRDATPTTVFSSDLTITSTTTGNDATISANDTITPGTWIWVRIDQCTAQPTQCIINVYGYLE